MTLTLSANINATTRRLRVTGSVTGIQPGYAFRLDDELLTLQGFISDGGRYQDPTGWYVNRGQDGSTAASHTAGADILGATDAFASSDSGTTPPSPWSGGSGPTGDGARLLDLGVVTLDDVGTTLYTPTEGEIVGPLLLRDLVFTTDGGASVSLLVVGDGTVLLAGFDSDLARDGSGYAANPSNDVAIVPTTDGPVTVALGPSGAADPPFAHPTWEAATAYLLTSIIAAGHVWTTFDELGGTSGSSEPDFAGNFGGTVADNDLTWNDAGVLGDGEVHVYAYVATPVVP